jgi:hypothetical protein
VLNTVLFQIHHYFGGCLLCRHLGTHFRNNGDGSRPRHHYPRHCLD